MDVTFSVPAGTRVALLGRNGSGKSTLLRVLATALRLHLGSASVLGHSLRTDAWAIRRSSALLAHATYLYESLSALQNLEVVGRFLDRPPSRDEIVEVLRMVGLQDRCEDPPSAFSAGMRRRLSLARLLLQRPAVAFLDEPYAQLDRQGTELVDALLASFARDGVTVLMATHHLERSVPFTDSTLTLEDGRLVA